MPSFHTSMPSRSLLLSKKDLDDLHAILRAEIRAYVDRRVMNEEATIAPAVCAAFMAFVHDHPEISIPTFADVLYRLTLSSVFNCFQFIRKSVRDPSNMTLTSQLTTEIALQLPFDHCMNIYPD
ncbi:MAG: hypothetical protein PHZ00_07595 [Candidatus Peribacteraceae bacterium]|nr:hypothetical protein [Candidatus Peribacteraceae bacterium]